MNNQYKRKKRLKAVWRRTIFFGGLGIIAALLVIWSLGNAQIPEVSDPVPTSTLVDDHQALEEAYEKIAELEKWNAFYRDGTPKYSKDHDGAPIYDALPLAEDLQEYLFLKCVDYSIPEYYELILAMMWQECHFKANSISSTNDYGLMQINKVNHDWLREELGVTDFLNPRQSIDCGVHIVASLLHEYKYDVNKALMAYNMGRSGAARAWKQGITKSTYSKDITTKQVLVKQNRYAD